MADSEARVGGFLVDSQLPRALAIALTDAGFDAVHVADWHGGIYRNARDADLLARAALEHRAIITYDLATLPNDAYAMLMAGESFAGVLVVTRSIGQGDVGRQRRAVLAALAEHGHLGNVVVYLRPPAG